MFCVSTGNQQNHHEKTLLVYPFFKKFSLFQNSSIL